MEYYLNLQARSAMTYSAKHKHRIDAYLNLKTLTCTKIEELDCLLKRFFMSLRKIMGPVGNIKLSILMHHQRSLEPLLK